jgi:hypothetical protein
MRIWVARFLIGMVLVFNVQCAVMFFVAPQQYAPAYELFGIAGVAAIEGIGVLFLMWNVPYAFALWHPTIRWVSLLEAVIMQAIGVVGEVWILSALPSGHETLSLSIRRFIGFDSVGLLFLILAACVIRRHPAKNTGERL